MSTCVTRRDVLYRGTSFAKLSSATQYAYAASFTLEILSRAVRFFERD
jgi:hypothetical protein